MDAEQHSLTRFQQYLIKKSNKQGGAEEVRCQARPGQLTCKPDWGAAAAGASTNTSGIRQLNLTAKPPSTAPTFPSARPSLSSDDGPGSAAAAASLAAIARSLAVSTPGSRASKNPALNASYAALADAADNLAATIAAQGMQISRPSSRCMTPEIEKLGGHQVDTNKQLNVNSVQQRVAQAACAVQQECRATPSGLLHPFGKSSARPVGGSGRLQAPRFAPLSPLLELARRNQQQQQQQQQQGNPNNLLHATETTAASRPCTASPITHSLPIDGGRPMTGRCTPSCNGNKVSHTNRSRAGPGDPGSCIAQVLTVQHGNLGAGSELEQSLNPPHAEAVQHGRAPVTATNDRLLDPVELFLDHPEIVRLDRWPPATPVRESQVTNDAVARGVNSILGALRLRVISHGAPSVLRAFQLADPNNTGIMEPQTFQNVLQSFNLDSVGNINEQDALLEVLSSDASGLINYVDLVNAAKSNSLPYRSYCRKFRHRTEGNPEQPIGQPAVRFPYGTLADVEVNNADIRTRLDNVLKELHTSFQATDPEATGVIGRAQFTAALQHVSTQFKLGLTAEYIGRVHREADALYNGRIDYNEFLSKHAPGAGVQGGRFLPGFLQPPSLRGSQLGAVWEWRPAPDMMLPVQQTSSSTEAPKPVKGTGKRQYTRDLDAPPATPLVLPGSRLLRSLQGGCTP